VQKDYGEAEQHFATLHVRKPSEPVVIDDLALSLCEQNDAAKQAQALEYAEGNVRTYPKCPDFAATYAWVLYRAGRLDDAEEQFQKSVTLGKMSAEMAYRGARIAVDRGRKAEAKKMLEEALRSPAFFRERPDAETLLTAISPESPYAFHVGEAVRVIVAKVELRDPSNGSKVLSTVGASKVLKIVEIKNGRLLVDAGGPAVRGWIHGNQVVKHLSAPKSGRADVKKAGKPT
jgi:tetratricopeptide (TPR) repeat protein